MNSGTSNILFLFGGLPHYYNFVLNKLNNVEGLNVTVAVPDNKNKTLGKNVFQTNETVKFKVHYLEEKKSFYRKPILKGIENLIDEVKPNIIVFIWPYVLQLVFNPLLLLKIKGQKIKLLYKDIPFLIPEFIDGLKLIKRQIVTENQRHFQNKKIFFLLPLLTLLRKYFLNLFDAHIYYAEKAYKIIGSYGIDKKKIFIIYNSPDTEMLFEAKLKGKTQPNLLDENKNRIIHVGRLVAWKKVDMLIRATANLKSKYQNIELLIIGNGPEESYLMELCKNLDIEKNVKFIGAVYDPVVLAKFMMESSIYVLAGMGGLSINEAMVFGKPIICSVCDGTEEKLVRDEINGKYFEEDNEDDLTNKIDYLLSSPEKIKTMGQSSEDIIKNEINIFTVINGYLNAFNYLLKTNYKMK